MGGSPACPLCGLETCGHYALGLDMTSQEAYGGELYEEFEQALARARENEDADFYGVFDDLVSDMEALPLIPVDSDFDEPCRSSRIVVLYAKTKTDMKKAARFLSKY